MPAIQGASIASEPLRRPRALGATPHPAAERAFTVLLVDDNHNHRMPILSALRERGHDVLYAADGIVADELCHASQLDIDALVTCTDMRRMSGFELARRVERMRPEVRVLLMQRRLETSEEARQADAHGYARIDEPFTPDQLCVQLTDLVASPRTHRPDEATDRPQEMHHEAQRHPEIY